MDVEGVDDMTSVFGRNTRCGCFLLSTTRIWMNHIYKRSLK